VMDLLKELGFSKQLFWPLSIYLIVVNPLLEELFWRGVVLNELDDLKLPVKHFGIIWSSLTYALFHYLIFRLVLFPGFAELGIVMLALFGALLAVVYRKTGSIVTTALTHGLLTDLAAIVLILNLFRRYPGVL
ncbi:MAG: CPBP family intramembrane metalloprotease, partial [Candidatus Obscuribacterales bacterium]|nr:CPBP family intramembrane metalloprotease [Candidatus Obscuribacterales bacterium]